MILSTAALRKSRTFARQGAAEMLKATHRGPHLLLPHPLARGLDLEA
jgi:hypothetical protein